MWVTKVSFDWRGCAGGWPSSRGAREGVTWPARFKEGTRPEPPPAAKTEEVVQDSLF